MKKTALVTGAASGIGRHVAIKLFNLGFEIIAVDRMACNFDESISSCVLDLSDESGFSAVINAIAHLDIAVNCAGVPCQRKSLVEFSGSELVREWEENFLATFTALKFEIIKMKQQRAGKIINIASSTAHSGMQNMVAYSAAKASIVNMTKVAAIENAPFNIQVNSISPASIDTPMLRKKYNGELPDYSQIYYTNNCGSTNDVFSAVKMFIENNFLTGHDLIIDGGLSDLCSLNIRQ